MPPVNHVPLAELAAWCRNDLSYKVDGTGALMAYGPLKGLPAAGPLRRAAFDLGFQLKLTPVHLMVNILPPGCVVPVHVDPGPRFERWHLPIEANPECWMWQEGWEGKRFPKVGHWVGPLEYWIPHQVGNEGTTSRTHLVVDLEG